MHIRDSEKRVKRHSCYWIASLLDAGYIPLIEQIDTAQEDWAERERHWIAFYRTSNPGRLTNLTDGGEGCAGIKRSVADVERTRRQSKERWADPEYREKLLKKLRSDDVRERRVANAAEAMKNPEAKERHRLATKEALNRKEVQDRRRIALAKSMSNPDVKAKYLATLDRARTDPEIVARHRVESKRAQADPVLRAHLRETSKAAWTPERRARQAEIARRSNEKQRAEGFSGNRSTWTPERRALAAERMRIRNDARRAEAELRGEQG